MEAGWTGEGSRSKKEGMTLALDETLSLLPSGWQTATPSKAVWVLHR